MTKLASEPNPVLVHTRYPEINEERFDLRRDGESVGFADTVDCGHEVWIMELCVRPDHRRRGYATTLLEAMVARHTGRVLALSCEPIEWEGWPPTRPAERLSVTALAGWYTRHGFRRDGGHRMVRHP